MVAKPIFVAGLPTGFEATANARANGFALKTLTNSAAVVSLPGLEFKPIWMVRPLTTAIVGLAAPPRLVLVTSIRIPLPAAPVATAVKVMSRLPPVLKFEDTDAWFPPLSFSGE